MDSSDFKSNESFFKKDSSDQKSGFGFAERNAKSVLRSKICFWIHRKEHTLRKLDLIFMTTTHVLVEGTTWAGFCSPGIPAYLQKNILYLSNLYLNAGSLHCDSCCCFFHNNMKCIKVDLWGFKSSRRHIVLKDPP